MSFLTFRAARRKAKKIQSSVARRTARPSSLDSFQSPYVVEITDSANDTLNLVPRQFDDDLLPAGLSSPQVALDLSSEPLFPHDIFVANPKNGSLDDVKYAEAGENVAGGSSFGGSSIGASRSWPEDIQETGENDGVETGSFVELSNADDEKSPPQPLRKPFKGAPAPIRIPTLSRHAPKVQIQRSAGKVAPSAYPLPSNAERIDSPVTGDDNASAISGFTLAGALAANAFSMQTEHLDSRQSRRITRKDSATLPHGYWKHNKRSPSVNDGTATAESQLKHPLPPMPSRFSKNAGSSLDLTTGSPSTNGYLGSSEVAYEPLHEDGESTKRRQARSQTAPPTSPPSRTPSSNRFFESEQHPGHRVSPIAEAPTPSVSALPTPDRTKVPSSAASSVPSSSSAANPQRSGTSESSQFLTSNSFRPSPFSDLSSRSGTDINHVLDDYISAAALDIKSAPPQEHNSGSSSPSVHSSKSTGRRSPDRLSGPRQRGNSGLVEAKSSRSSLSRSTSRPSLASVNSLLLHPSTLLPIGERRGSTFSASPASEEDDNLSALPSSIATSHSQHISQLPSFPESAGLLSAPFSPGVYTPAKSPPLPPDPLDELIVAGAESTAMRRPSERLTTLKNSRDRSSYAIAVGEQSTSPSMSTPSTADKQTFPETPSAFSPMFSPIGESLSSRPSVSTAALRTLSVNRGARAQSTRISHRAVSRSTSIKTRKRTMKGKASKTGLAMENLPTRPSSGRAETASSPLPQTASTSKLPKDASRDTEVAETVPGSSRPPQQSAAATVTSQRSGSSLRRTIPPPPQAVPPPPPPNVPRPPSLLDDASSIDSPHSSAPPPPYQSVANANAGAPSVGPNVNAAASLAPYGSLSNRRMQSRPPLPIGPRNRNASGPASVVNRERNGSNGSLLSASDSLSRPSGSFSSGSAPKFQPAPVKYKGYTMEAAKWTFSSEQLQTIVSKAIKQSAEASSIRLLPPHLLTVEVPQELERLEALQAELKVKYKLQVRKRNTLLSAISAQLDGQEAGAYTTRSKLDDLQDVSANLDQIAEDLYAARDQAAQLTRLTVVHSGSALAMALRKLNASFLKRSAEVQSLHQHIAELEAERDEAWSQAQQVAQDLDDLNESIQEPAVRSTWHSRHSSRVLASRKSSIRVSKAGLRSSRSHRGSVASQIGASRTSYLSSAGTPSFLPDIVPPVPPILLHRGPIGIVTTGLSSRNSAMDNSGFSSSSESRALAQAQMDLYNMLGIPLQDATVPDPRLRRSSTSAVISPSSGCPPTVLRSPRPVSDMNGHRTTRSMDAFDAVEALISDDRQAVLATLRIMD